MPEELGLYWVRVKNEWYLVDWQRAQHSLGWQPLTTFHRTEYGFDLIDELWVSEIDEWGARVVEPGEHINPE